MGYYIVFDNFYFSFFSILCIEVKLYYYINDFDFDFNFNKLSNREF